MPSIWRLLFFGSTLLFLLCLFLAARGYWRAYNLRKYDVTVVATQMKVDAPPTHSSDPPEPEYHLTIDFVSDDGSGRTFHWEGDPGQARYPEEALDEYRRFQPGTKHTIETLRGNSREIRLNTLEDSPEFNSGVGWTFAAFFASAFVLASYMVTGKGGINSGAWMAFAFFGIMPLLGSIPLGYFSVKKMLTWRPVSVTRIGNLTEATTYDVTTAPPGVQFTPAVREIFAAHPYTLYEYQYGGRTLHLGRGHWGGVLDTLAVILEDAKPEMFVSPVDRWQVDSKLDWQQTVYFPTGIALFFGLAFSAAAFGMYKIESR